MLGSLGLPELLFIMLLALLVFGPRRLPEIGRTIGRALGEFRRATTDLKRSMDVELRSEDFRERPTPPASASRPAPVIRPALEAKASSPPGGGDEESSDMPAASGDEAPDSAVRRASDGPAEDGSPPDADSPGGTS